MFGFSYYLLLPLARGTNGNGYSSSAPLLPTPLASDTGDVGKGLDIQISANGSYRKMNTVRKSENLLPFPVISAAANGDTNAMCAILKHYEGYIAKLCTRTLKDDAGNTYSYVDEEMRNRLQVRLITRTLAFHVG